jgi:hypothetical protein
VLDTVFTADICEYLSSRHSYRSTALDRSEGRGPFSLPRRYLPGAHFARKTYSIWPVVICPRVRVRVRVGVRVRVRVRVRGKSGWFARMQGKSGLGQIVRRPNRVAGKLTLGHYTPLKSDTGPLVNVTIKGSLDTL